MSAGEMALAILRVAGLALVFGAAVPVLFALGVRVHAGKPICDESGEIVGETGASPVMKCLGWTIYTLLAVVIFLAIVWVARDSIGYYTGWHPFGAVGGH